MGLHTGQTHRGDGLIADVPTLKALAPQSPNRARASGETLLDPARNSSAGPAEARSVPLGPVRSQSAGYRPASAGSSERRHERGPQIPISGSHVIQRASPGRSSAGTAGSGLGGVHELNRQPGRADRPSRSGSRTSPGRDATACPASSRRQPRCGGQAKDCLGRWCPGAGHPTPAEDYGGVLSGGFRPPRKGRPEKAAAVALTV